MISASGGLEPRKARTFAACRATDGHGRSRPLRCGGRGRARCVVGVRAGALEDLQRRGEAGMPPGALCQGAWYDSVTMEGLSVGPSCGQQNPAGMRFCGRCATALPLTCPACGQASPAGMQFCGYCAAPLAGAPPGSPSAAPSTATPLPHPGSTLQAASATATAAPPAEERRLVTALFCDLVGFTPASEQLDPEEVRDVQAAYFNAMSAQIERYGGTVEKYAGDAVLALFGAPMAHEDDAERAVLCALGMQDAIEPVAALARERWQAEPAIRVGVNTGEVVSGIWNASGRQDVAVTGDAVNTSARIQAAAEPGEVLAGEETMQLTRRRIRYGEKRDLVLKGKAGTIPVWPALGLREQLGERWEEPEHLSPLVGREREVAQLVDAWTRAREGEGQLLTVVGDAGVGKSRLISELVGRITSGAAIRVVRGRCLSYGQEISLWLVADLLRGMLGIREQEPLDEVRVKLSTAIASLLTGQDAGTQADAIDVLGEVLGLPPEDSLLATAGAQVRRQAVVRGLRLLLSAVSERAPTLMVLEDLHWIDAASQEVLTEVLADVPGLRLLVLAAQRPGWNAAWGEWGWPERLTLRPLSDQDAAVLAGTVLGGKALSVELEQYVAERAGGNPFFVEEMLRALQEAGDLVERDGQMHLVRGAAERLPSTLTEVLLARLDRLEGEVRALTQMASVIGRNFAIRLLAQVSGQEVQELELPLASLQRAEIAFPRRGPDLEYVFKHVSMREVAYNTLVQKRRQALHLATARAIATLYPAEEYVEMIAYHYARTEEHGEAAEWLEKAGDRAAGVYANETAIGNYQEARRRRELVGGAGRDRARLNEKLGGVLRIAGRYDEALEALEPAAAAYREVRDLEGVGRTIAAVGMTHRARGMPEEGIARIQPLLELLASSGPSKGLASLHLALSYLYFSSGRFRETLEAAERAAELARAVGEERILAGAEMRRGTALTLLGQAEEGRKALERSIHLAEAVGDLEILGTAHNNLAECFLKAGEPEETRKHLERALEIHGRTGHTGIIGFQMECLGEALSYLGEWEEAAGYIERGAEVIRRAGASWWAAYGPVQRGHLRLRQGRWEEAAQDLQETIALAEPTSDAQALGYAHWLLGELEVLQGQAQAARARLDSFGTDGPFGVPQVATLAWAYLELGELDRAEETARRGQIMARERDHGLWMPEVLRVQGMILTREERRQEAEQAFTEAAYLARSMPYPYAEARALHEHGMLHLRWKDPEQARQYLTEALAIFRRLGAKKDIERTEQAMPGLC
jgi:adenylate cyclase